jgi:hypothetical protein
MYNIKRIISRTEIDMEQHQVANGMGLTFALLPFIQKFFGNLYKTF